MPPLRWTSWIVVLLLSSVAANPQTPSQAMTPGWPVASTAESGLSDARLRSLDVAIRSGEFKKIGSALIARHG